MKANVIICIAHTTYGNLSNLAQNVSGIDLICAGMSMSSRYLPLIAM